MPMKHTADNIMSNAYPLSNYFLLFPTYPLYPVEEELSALIRYRNRWAKHRKQLISTDQPALAWFVLNLILIAVVVTESFDLRKILSTHMLLIGLTSWGLYMNGISNIISDW